MERSSPLFSIVSHYLFVGDVVFKDCGDVVTFYEFGAWFVKEVVMVLWSSS